ncbi:protein TolQ [Formicincola oecophyllae]|uniref:Protein TolQ n=1 Tax=Formicincola oecophyllae TaxID=2558361 RepID=A0A4Y6UBB8_9PROT|nr:protein TolQ [Formicincola oecophyllae]QDH14424.1 protein TolQ [Formicincola oecophyllae]
MEQNMAAGAAQAVSQASLQPAGGLSPLQLFLHASLTVQLVMVGLFLCSVFVWAVIIQKVIFLKRLNKEATVFENRFWAGGSLDALYENEGVRPSGPMAAVFGAAMAEWRRSHAGGVDMTRPATQERIDRAINVTIARENERLTRFMSALATIGPVAPFVGLFGTVWGIMHAFDAIGAMHNTNLSVVAPGISEALFATALGLLTAIPAYVAYNLLSRAIDSFDERMENFGTEFAAILSRQSEEQRARALKGAPQPTSDLQGQG